MANKKEMTVVNNKYRIKERDVSDRIFPKRRYHMHNQ